MHRLGDAVHCEVTFTWLTHAACDSPAERCPIGRNSQHRGSYYMPWHQFDVSSASSEAAAGGEELAL